jgi:hypothetical protein
MFIIRLFYESAGLGMQPVLLCPRRNHFAPMHEGGMESIATYGMNILMANRLFVNRIG